MPKLTPEKLRSRLALDWRTTTAAVGACTLVDARAYRRSSDMRAGRDEIVTPGDAGGAAHWALTFYLRTLSGPGLYTRGVRIHVDLLANGNYPFTEPTCWVQSRPIPWSPHFREGSPVCLGSLWDRKAGTTLLAELVRHLAKLINFDEVPRGGGYVGWNREAIDYWANELGSQPIDGDVEYPALDAALVHGSGPALFRPLVASSDAGRRSVFRAAR